MGNFSKDAGTDGKADKNLKTSGKVCLCWYIWVCVLGVGGWFLPESIRANHSTALRAALGYHTVQPWTMIWACPPVLCCRLFAALYHGCNVAYCSVCCTVT
jgi:hypothetical protein